MIGRVGVGTLEEVRLPFCMESPSGDREMNLRQMQMMVFGWQLGRRKKICPIQRKIVPETWCSVGYGSVTDLRGVHPP